jgi:tetratricopeptide (TPR) repeat protein
MERKELIMDLITEVDEVERAFYEGLSKEERENTGSFDHWSVRDLRAHIAAWKESMADNILAAKNGRPPQVVEDYDQENANTYEQHRDKTWEQVAKFSDAATHKLIQQVDSLKESQLDSTDFLPWPNGRPLWRLVAGYCYSHPMIHLAGYYREKGENRRAGELIGRMSRSMAGLDDSPEWQGVTKYNLACQYSLLGETGKAIEELRDALEYNPDLIEYSKEDPDLDPIRESAGYRAIHESIAAGE